MNFLKQFKFVVLLSAVLLSVQLSSLWHAAEHDFAPHEHNGVSCEVLHYLKGSSDAIAKIASLHVFESLESFSPRVNTVEALVKRDISSNGARAPPSIV